MQESLGGRRIDVGRWFARSKKIKREVGKRGMMKLQGIF
jgi:endogenous inhibitor of DNA gyrase (YacG/DUF329 family)